VPAQTLSRLNEGAPGHHGRLLPAPAPPSPARPSGCTGRGRPALPLDCRPRPIGSLTRFHFHVPDDTALPSPIRPPAGGYDAGYYGLRLGGLPSPRTWPRFQGRARRLPRTGAGMRDAPGDLLPGDARGSSGLDRGLPRPPAANGRSCRSSGSSRRPAAGPGRHAVLTRPGPPGVGDGRRHGRGETIDLPGRQPPHQSNAVTKAPHPDDHRRSYPVPDWLVALPSEQAVVDATPRSSSAPAARPGIDLPTDGELYRFDVINPSGHERHDRVFHPAHGRHHVRRRALDRRGVSPAHSPMGFRRKPAGS